jgi:hypothetical protein
VSHAPDLVAEIANELDTWPGVHIEARSEGGALVRYEELELGFVDPERGLVELSFAPLEDEALVLQRTRHSSSTGMPSRPSIRHRNPRELATESRGRPT